MSITNRATDRDANGRLKRSYRGPNWVQSTPSWWTHVHMNRPQRHENRRLCRLIVAGDHTDSTVWPVGSRKPHRYYW